MGDGAASNCGACSIPISCLSSLIRIGQEFSLSPYVAPSPLNAGPFWEELLQAFFCLQEMVMPLSHPPPAGTLPIIRRLGARAGTDGCAWVRDQIPTFFDPGFVPSRGRRYYAFKAEAQQDVMSLSAVQQFYGGILKGTATAAAEWGHRRVDKALHAHWARVQGGGVVDRVETDPEESAEGSSIDSDGSGGTGEDEEHLEWD